MAIAFEIFSVQSRNGYPLSSIYLHDNLKAILTSNLIELHWCLYQICSSLNDAAYNERLYGHIDVHPVLAQIHPLADNPTPGLRLPKKKTF